MRSCDSYNKNGQVSTRVGNWVEEQALKESTGQTRYQVSKKKTLSFIFPLLLYDNPKLNNNNLNMY